MEPRAVGLALATLEALLGRRGLHQLRPRLEHSAFLQLGSLVDSGFFSRSVLGKLRVQMPSPTALEATARISLDQRWLAGVIRLDHTDDWVVSHLTVIGSPAPRLHETRPSVSWS